MISIKGLNKFYNKGKQNEIHVINDVTLDLPDRGMVAVFGKSGCGKTTLLNVIGGLDSFASGSLKIEGQSIAVDTDNIRNRYIGYIFQNYNLSKSETCFENVADAVRLCGVTDEQIIKERVSAALENVDMANYAKRTPDTLSGGQQQRIAIARAIVKNPRIILADEPTGNLDETNTVMIMNLLKAISKDHLVILVTHELSLVDYYCDKVIELSDGRIVNVKDNDAALGFDGRDKNSIYLAEYEKREIIDSGAQIEYYGDIPKTPVKLRIINNGSKIYLSVDTPKVEIIDESSEIKIREGIFEQKAESKNIDNIDMSRLPPIEGSRFGRLFSFGSSIRSGYRTNFKRNKKSIRALKACMFLFAMAVVFMTSIFGIAFRDLRNAKNEYNENVFYVYTPDETVSEKLNLAIGNPDAAIDFTRLEGWELSGKRVDFRVGSFETFEQSFYSTAFSVNAVLLDNTLCKDAELVEGKHSDLAENDIVITTKLADVLLEKASVGYIDGYDDLIGIISSNLYLGGRGARIVGIVRSDESSIYASQTSLAQYINSSTTQSYTYRASLSGLDVDDGKIVLVKGILPGNPVYPEIGDVIKIQGIDFEVSDILVFYSQYSDWLIANGISVKDSDTFFADLTLEMYPTIDTESQEYKNALKDVANSRYFEYYDYYYSKIGDYISDRSRFYSEIDSWLYLEKEIDEMKFVFCDENYCKASQYKAENGRYPTKAEYDIIFSTLSGTVDKDFYYDLYEAEYNLVGVKDQDLVSNGIYVSDNDFIKLSKRVGQTHPVASQVRDTYVYTALHSTNPSKTEEWLNREFADLTHENYDVIITPSDVLSVFLAERRESIISSLISLAVMLTVMCICMYFVMRSSLMNRIKEVGIYRAIGVSKRNLVFRFLVEAGVLTAMTVLIGYFAVSAFIYVGLGISPLVGEVLYYPIWYAFLVLVLIVSVSLICGILPIIFLLRKTPSEILAKYDI